MTRSPASAKLYKTDTDNHRYDLSLWRIILDKPPFGVLIANLGTPEAPTAKAVRSYLREFLSDRRVVDVPRLLWWLMGRVQVMKRKEKRWVRHAHGRRPAIFRAVRRMNRHGSFGSLEWPSGVARAIPRHLLAATDAGCVA